MLLLIRYRTLFAEHKSMMVYNSPNEEIWMSKKVGVHFKQRALFKNERRQNDLGEVHANTDLRQEVSD